jgi:hypothetical protein
VTTGCVLNSLFVVCADSDASGIILEVKCCSMKVLEFVNIDVAVVIATLSDILDGNVDTLFEISTVVIV